MPATKAKQRSNPKHIADQPQSAPKLLQRFGTKSNDRKPTRTRITPHYHDTTLYCAGLTTRSGLDRAPADALAAAAGSRQCVPPAAAMPALAVHLIAHAFIHTRAFTQTCAGQQRGPQCTHTHIHMLMCRPAHRQENAHILTCTCAGQHTGKTMHINASAVHTYHCIVDGARHQHAAV